MAPTRDARFDHDRRRVTTQLSMQFHELCVN